MAQPADGGLEEPLRGPDGVVLPASFAPLADRLADGGITLTALVTGEVRIGDAFRFLMADDTLTYAQVGSWSEEIESLVDARRLELLGQRLPVYEAHLSGLMSTGAIGTTDAQIEAFHHAMSSGPDQSETPEDLAARPHLTAPATLDAQPGAEALADDQIPAQLRPIIDRLAAGRITLVDAELGELGDAATLRALLGDDTVGTAQLMRWASRLHGWVAQRRHEVLGDRTSAHELRLAELLNAGTSEHDAPGLALRAVTAEVEDSTQPGGQAEPEQLRYRHSAFFADHDLAEACAQALRTAAYDVEVDGDDNAGWDLTAIGGEPAADNSGIDQVAQIVREHGGEYHGRETLPATGSGHTSASSTPAPARSQIPARTAGVTRPAEADGPPSEPHPRAPDDLLGELIRADGTAASAPAAGSEEPLAAGTAEVPPASRPAPAAGLRFRPAGQQDLAPSTPVARARANLAALRMMAEIEASDGPATGAQQAVLARWGGWGSVPQIFDDDNPQWEPMRAQLRELLSDSEYRAAARTTLNAHYTDAGFVTEIWSAMQALGFAGGQVIEPGSGAGVFLGLAPDSAQLTGVELDPTTAAISRLLYPHARILAESFAHTRAPSASFDAAIGNVPFGDVVLHDPRHNPHRLTIHNHFLVKALDLVKPGGLLAMLTSAYTMDAANPATRRLLAGQADLIGAIRLPSRAHRAAAGTDALTDILLLRRREPGREPDSVQWELTNRIEINNHALRINEYFVHHPDLVLGELISGDGLYRDGELAVRGPVGDGLIAALRQALDALVASGRERQLTFDPQSGGNTSEPVMLTGQGDGRPEAHIQVTAAGGFDVVHSGIVVAHEVPASQAAELRALLELRDLTMALLGAEAATLDDTDEISDMRGRLNRRYDAYSLRYGPINRFTIRNTGHTDPLTGDPKTARIRPPQGRFREDTYAAAVFALEHFDGDTQTARKVDLFTQRVIAPRPVRQGADNPADALAIVMDAAGRVDIEHIAALLGVDAGEARAMLGDLVFPDPTASGQLQPAAAYLSGNVRVKLAQAELAAETDPQYEANVAALRAVIPEDIQPVDIHAALGSVWISAGYVQQFLQEILEDRSVRVTRPGWSIWVVEGGDRGGVQSREVWGTARMPAVKLAAAMLEQRPINIYDIIETAGGEKRKLNGEATAAAREKGRELNERFGEWIWEEPARADTLVRSYNQAFNGLVLRNYDDAAPALPGLAASFTLRPHQLAAVARIIAEPAVLLGHEVGAGKTLEMIAGAMELRRLGLARKPAVIIPNHMIEQFAREWLQGLPPGQDPHGDA